MLYKHLVASDPRQEKAPRLTDPMLINCKAEFEPHEKEETESVRSGSRSSKSTLYLRKNEIRHFKRQTIFFEVGPDLCKEAALVL